MQRQIILVGIGAAVILSVAFCNYRFVHNIDSAYSRIISLENRIYASVQAITTETSAIQRSLLNMLLTDERSEIALLKSDVFQASIKIDHLYTKLDEMKGLQQRELLGKVELACLAYRQASVTFISLVQNRQTASAIRFNSKELHPLFLEYQNAQDKFISAVSSHCARSSQQLSSQANILGILTISIAGVPFAAWAGGLMVLLFWFFVGSRRTNQVLQR